MRVHLVPDIDSRDGTSNRDERLTNVLSETDEGVTLACVRPGVVAVATSSGNGNGLTNFAGTLISVFGATAGFGATPSTIGTVGSGVTDFAQSPL